MDLANREAQRLNHNYVGTEHVLLGLLRGDFGVALSVLKSLDIDLEKVRLELEKIVQPGSDMVSMDILSLTPRTEKALRYAYEEARNLKHNYVGTEHILSGLLREQGGVAAQVLEYLGLKAEEVREETLRCLGEEDRLEQRVGGQPGSDHKSLEQQDYWRVPRNSMDLPEVLVKYGFDERHPPEEQSKEGIISIVYRLDKMVARFVKDIANPVIVYDSNDPEQIEEALYLRDVLEQNKQSYDESPSRRKVVEELRKPFQKTISLADRLEGEK